MVVKMKVVMKKRKYENENESNIMKKMRENEMKENVKVLLMKESSINNMKVLREGESIMKVIESGKGIVVIILWKVIAVKEKEEYCEESIVNVYVVMKKSNVWK